MKFKERLNMSVDDWRNYVNDEDYEFAYGTVDFISTKPNSHRIVYSEDVLKEYAKSIINKWVIAEYDEYEQDATTHTANQKIVGRIPEQEIKFRYDKDGYLIASADVILSKLYANDVYSLFVDNNFRAVSVEHLVNYTPETEHYETGYNDKDVEAFNITGVTILGLKYNPSVPNASIHLTQMSEDTLQKAESEYHKYSEKLEEFVSHPINTSKEALDTGDWDGDKAKRDLIKEKNFKSLAKKVCMKLEEGWQDREITKLDYPVMNINEGEWVYNRKGLASALSYAKQHNESAVVSKIEKIYRKLGLDQEEKMDTILEKLEQIIDKKLDKEETMAEEIKDTTVEEVANAEVETETQTEAETTEETMSEQVETESCEDKEMACGDTETVKDEEDTESEADKSTDEKMSALEAELQETKTELAQYKEQVEQLQAYKDGIEKQKTDNIIQETLSKIKGNVTDSVYGEIVEQSKDCTPETVGAWKNESLAKAYAGLAEKMSKNEEFMDMGKPETLENSDSTSVFDRM